MTSNIKTRSVGKDIAIFIRYGLFESDMEIINLHQTKGTHWVACKKKNFFDSYGSYPPQKSSKFLFITKWLLFRF